MMQEVPRIPEPREVRAEQYPAESDLPSRLRFLVPYAALAPSSHNTQPWCFTIDGDSVQVLADDDRHLECADADRREFFVSIGCALENLIIAAEHFHFAAKVLHFPDGEDGPVARVELEDDAVPMTRRPPELFDAIVERQTNRELYDERGVDAGTLEKLHTLCFEEGLGINFVEDIRHREQIGRYMARADIRQFADRQWRRELAHWIGRGAFGDSWLRARLGKAAVKRLDLGERTAKENVARIHSAPVFAVITTEEDSLRARVEAGQALQRMWLKATDLGLAVHPMNQVLQIATIKEQFSRLLRLGDRVPQVAMRIGYARRDDSQTPRRTIDEILK